LLRDYPDITVEFDVNYGFRDIVADRFDAGVRMGSTIDKDMIVVPIGPPLRLAVIASPAYFAAHPAPRLPRDLDGSLLLRTRWPWTPCAFAGDAFARLAPALKRPASPVERHQREFSSCSRSQFSLSSPRVGERRVRSPSMLARRVFRLPLCPGARQLMKITSPHLLRSSNTSR